MSAFNRALNVLDALLNRFLQFLLITVTVAVTWQVFSRYVLNDPSSFTEELARFLLIWITLLGCVLAYRHNNHLGLDMIYSQASEPYRKVMYFIIHGCVGLFAVCVMIIGGYLLMNMTDKLGQSSPVMGIEISWVYSVVPLSGVLILIYSLNALIFPQSIPDALEE
ncbi:TRAP transporter small permease [Glaciecola sp. SC05]|uniref:TRAP transporter small permease n=1 Tax=Glaciecola sp. SC05 TaxID=1987355 RepID=UPI003527D920